MVGIYKITNPNNRIYIRQSTDIKNRWNKYKKLYCKDQPSLFNSLKKLNIQQANLNKCCHYKVKSAGGYVWKFKNLKNNI